jgi:hypothetical protein
VVMREVLADNEEEVVSVAFDTADVYGVVAV